MKVRELIEMLREHDQEREVIMAKDAEGNGFSPFYEAATASYRADSKWSGEIGLEPADLTPAQKKQGYSEEDALEDGVPALVLWPVN